MTTRFMAIRKADEETEAGVPPTAELLRAMNESHDELSKSMVFLSEGLKSRSTGVRIFLSKGEATVTDGVFAETEELIGGFAIVEAKSREEVVEAAKKWPQIDHHGNIELEIRELFGPGDVC